MHKEELIKAQERIAKYIHRTPVLTSATLDKMTGAKLFFKCENFQKMGAFKMRGATNAMLSLSPEQRARGVVTHSSGNMAQAVALGAKSLGIKAYIVMPNNAPQVKKDAVAGYGGIISISENTADARARMAGALVEQLGASFIHPSNDLQVIYGQATSAMELLEDHAKLDAIITPVGGGGLLAGTALAAHHFAQNCKVYAGEPYEADDAYRSMKSGKIELNETSHTIADGLRTHLGSINFPIIRSHVSDIIRVNESEIIQAMRLIWERMKIIIEPSCAVPLAAVLRDKEKFQSKKVGIILTGGNVDLTQLPF